MKRIDTPDGRFAAGDPTIRKPGTLVTSSWMNALQDEICNAIEGAGLTLDENNPAQLHTVLTQGYAPKTHTHPWADITDKPTQATRWPTWYEVTEKPASFGAPIHSIVALPTTNVGPIIVAEASEVWVWVSNAYFTGYRSPLCGRPVDGHTLIPLSNEIDAVGGLLSKSAYAGLWGYAQENGLVVEQTDWSENLGAHWFVDVSDTQFRVPDLRNQFRRFTGTDADTTNARTLGTQQGDAVHAPANWGFARYAIGMESVSSYDEYGAQIELALTPTSGTPVLFAGGSETRPSNTAYYPRIHI